MSHPVNRGSAKGRTYRFWKMAVCQLPGFKSNIVGRQQKRATRRKHALAHLAEQFGGEPRRTLRAMAFALAKRPGVIPR